MDRRHVALSDRKKRGVSRWSEVVAVHGAIEARVARLKSEARRGGLYIEHGVVVRYFHRSLR